MENTNPLFPLIRFVMLFLFCASLAYSQEYVIVDRENGDRLTGLWRGATETHFDIEYNGQVLTFPLEGVTLSFTSNLENVPDRSSEKHFRNGLALLTLEFPELAKRKFEAALAEFPNHANAHYQLGLLLKAEAQIDEALKRFRSVAKIDAKNFDLVPLLQEIGDEALTTEAYVQAVNAYLLILIHYPEHESVEMLSYQTGFLLSEKLDNAEASLELLEKAITQFPEAYEREKAVYQIGTLQVEIGKPEDALRTMGDLITLYPDGEWVDDAHLKRAIIYLHLGDNEKASKEATLVRDSTEDTFLEEQARKVLEESAWDVYTDGLPDTQIQAIAIDGTSLWIGTPKGIAQIETGNATGWEVNEGAAWQINNHLPVVPDVTTIAANASEIWVGTRNQGVLYYDRKSTEVKNYALTEDLRNAWIRDIKMDKNEIWFATEAGVVRWMRETGTTFHYDASNSPVPNNIHTLALTPETVWIGTSGSNIAIFDRESEIWNPYKSTEIAPETQIVKFNVVDEKLFLTWFNAEDRANGYFQSDWDGARGISVSISTGNDEKTVLENIYITGTVDTTEVQPPPPPVPVDEETPPTPEPQTPLVLWLATDDYLAIQHTRSEAWDDSIGYPKIVLEDSTLQCIALNKDRVWIGTTNGIATIDEKTLSQPKD